MAQSAASRTAARKTTAKKTASKKKTAAKKSSALESHSEMGDLSDHPEVERRMTALRLPEPLTWQEARLREQTKAEIYRTLQASVLLQQERGKLVSRSEMQAAVELMRDTIYRAMQRVPQASARRVDARPAVRAKIKDAVDAEVREAFARAIAEATA
jgi:hypothetical protein